MSKNHILFLTYTIGHFIVDFACAFLIYQMVFGTEHWYLNLLFYNFCAFALQMPLGLLADKWNRNSLCAVLGCLLVAVAYGLGFLGPAAMVIAAGVGNGLYHIGGGIDVLNISGRKASLLGVFVAPGALGIYFGTLFGKQNGTYTWIVIFILLTLATTILLVTFTNKKSFQSENVAVSFQGIHSAAILITISCFLIVVCLRSYIGMISNFSWKSQGSWGIIFIGAVFLGKLTGGILSDRIGAIKASILSLGLASGLFLFSDIPVAGVVAVLFFNMTMPITLWALSRILQGAKGFAFGLLTFGLFLGFTPVYLGQKPVLTTSTGFAMAAFGSLVLLWLGLRKVVT